MSLRAAPPVQSHRAIKFSVNRPTRPCPPPLTLGRHSPPPLPPYSEIRARAGGSFPPLPDRAPPPQPAHSPDSLSPIAHNSKSRSESRCEPRATQSPPLRPHSESESG